MRVFKRGKSNLDDILVGDIATFFQGDKFCSDEIVSIHRDHLRMSRGSKVDYEDLYEVLRRPVASPEEPVKYWLEFLWALHANRDCRGKRLP